ncbi:U3 small nucleolar RNA-associated protein 14 homolog A [Aricia agestis]|uniref:U3 small nucleolar RNA-associated protein 14 homolog A n=1 Tax=Aricia agestis TaxID=91739 RepID=UPI001C202672|nr:U3 small nucleolar RNA-associated protein 14 homolog A [Aricia agestis]
MEENDDTDFVASEHDRLVNAITKLDKTQHITKPTRNEPTNVNSEFNLVKNSNKLRLSQVARVLEDTAHHVKIGKRLKSIQKTSKILSKPLEKPQAERVKRATGYQQAKTKLGRWDPVVARNRTVDFVSFPLKKFPSKLEPTKDFLSKMKLKSPLELELEEVDPPPPMEQEEEEEKYPMSYEEMLEQRQNMAKLRAQQSYHAAKAKRQSKIKSKKYHRILKKEKLKQQLKEFEDLQTKNPEEALKKLEELEKARALERHTLRHKNTGKWAKSKLVRAKYDKEVRQQLAEQLSVSRGLTHKTQKAESSDDDADNDENIPDMSLDQDPMNPWMLKKSNKPNVDAEFDFGYKKYLKDKMYKQKAESDSDSEEEQINSENQDINKSITSLKESIKKLSDNKSDAETQEFQEENTKVTQKTVKEKKTKKNMKVTSTSSWIVEPVDSVSFNTNTKQITSEEISSAFETFETKIANKIQSNMKKIKKELSKLEKPTKTKKQKNMKKEDDLEYLKLNQKAKAIIDESLIETNTKEIDDTVENTSTSKLSRILEETEPAAEKAKVDIDPTKFIEVKPKYLNTSIPSGENELDDLDDDEQVVPKVDIEEVFEEDDVVASFRQEKEEEKNKDKPEDIDLTMPGWGSWGGAGVKAPKRKKNRFIAKPAPKFPRRDENKGDVIIHEYKDPKLAAHRVADLPFPFTSVKDYEASIRAPIGNTFIPEQAHRKLIRPSLITKAGTVIEPMDEEELLVHSKKTYNNDRVMKMLGKK